MTMLDSIPTNNDYANSLLTKIHNFLYKKLIKKIK